MAGQFNHCTLVYTVAYIQLANYRVLIFCLLPIAFDRSEIKDYLITYLLSHFFQGASFTACSAVISVRYFLPCHVAEVAQLYF